MALTPGTRLGVYEITAQIGEGGMGQVYRATDTRLKRQVAIKILPPSLAADHDRLARFQREAEVLASLNHPNIAAIHGLEESAGITALVMELVEGDDLSQRIARGAIPIDEALPIAKQIAEALEAAHERGIVHRDLKPANIKVRDDGTVKVLDFGLAKPLGPARETTNLAESPTLTSPAMMTGVGVVLGTAAYMSPEQAKGHPVDRRADIWSFGIVLAEMLSGQRMFGGVTLSETLASVIRDEPRLGKRLASAPSGVRRLLRRCLDKDPQRRLQAIGEARIALEAVLAGEDQDEAAALTAEVRHGWLPWAAGAVVVLVAIGWFARARATQVMDQPLVRLSAELGPDAVAGQNVTVAISPDGARIVFPIRNLDGRQQLATRLLDQPQAVSLPGTENATDPFFSPDGQWIGFFADSKLKKTSVQGGSVTTLCEASPNARGAAWGEDGSIIAMLKGGASGLFRVPAAGGAPQPLTNPNERGEATHRWPQVLPGGRAVLFTASPVVGVSYEDATIDVLSLETGEWTVVQRGGYFGRYLPGGYLVYLRHGTLFGVKFDLDRLEVGGEPFPVLDDVAGNAGTGGGQFGFSNTGTFAYVSSRTPGQAWPIMWLEAGGRTQQLLAAPGQYYAPRLSPDGRRLAVTVGFGDIYIYDWGRDAMARLTVTNQRNAFPVWAPDGRHLVFASQTADGSSLNWIRADRAGDVRRLLESKNALTPFSFSPDGKHLAFHEQTVDSPTSIWTLPLDTGDADRPEPGKPEFVVAASNPAFSPDGRWLAYAQNGQVHVRPFPLGGGSGSGSWQISTGGGAWAFWSRTSPELFYQTPDDQIMAVSYMVDGGSFVADKPRPWSSAQIFRPNAGFWNADLAPDGKRFAVLPLRDALGEQRGSVHVTFLLNFVDELRRQMPEGQ